MYSCKSSNETYCSMLEVKFQAFLSLRKHKEKNLQKVRYIFLRMQLKGSYTSSRKANSFRDDLYFFFQFYANICESEYHSVHLFAYVEVISLDSFKYSPLKLILKIFRTDVDNTF